MQKQSWLVNSLCAKKQIRSIDFSYDLKYIASCGDSNEVSLWNIDNPKRNLHLTGHQAKCTSLTFSPYQNILASASLDNTIKLWYPASSIKPKTIKGHTQGVRSVEFSSDGRMILSGSADKSVKLWDIDTLKFKGNFIGHTNWVNCARMNQEMTTVCSGGEDKKLMIWDVETKKNMKLYEFDAPITSIGFHPQQKWVASTNSKFIEIHDLRMQKLVQHYEAHHDNVNSISIDPSGQFIVSVSSNSQIKVWSLKKGCLLFTLFGHNGSINSCNFSKKGDLFSTGGSDCNVLIWESGFSKKTKPFVKKIGMCQSGHRNDHRKITNMQQSTKKNQISSTTYL